jgi:hypothetical protein
MKKISGRDIRRDDQIQKFQRKRMPNNVVARYVVYAKIPSVVQGLILQLILGSHHNNYTVGE